MSEVQLRNHESNLTRDNCVVLSNSGLLEELELLMMGDDFVRVLTRSVQLSSIASRSADPEGLLGDLKSFASRGSFASLLAMESIASDKHHSADNQLM